MKSFLSTVALLVLACNLAICQTSTIDNRRITLSFTEDENVYLALYALADQVENAIGNIEDFSVDGQTVTLTFTDIVTEIGEDAFSDCSSLTSISIPNSVTEIGNWAFGSCSSLTSISIPNSVTEIGYFAFYGCSSLTSIFIPNSVTEIGAGAFADCSSLRNFSSKFASEDGRCLITNGELIAFAGDGLSNYTIPNSVTEIGAGAFYGCSSLTSISIPNSVTMIGDAAFADCSSLRNFSSKFASEDGRCLIINGKLIAFAGAGLSNYTIPNSVTEIGSGAFMDCSSLESVTISNSVTMIGSVAFAGCPLESVTVPRNAEIEEDSFEETTRIIYR